MTHGISDVNFDIEPRVWQINGLVHETLANAPYTSKIWTEIHPTAAEDSYRKGTIVDPLYHANWFNLGNELVARAERVKYSGGSFDAVYQQALHAIERCSRQF